MKITTGKSRKKGSSLVELAASLFVIVIMALFCFDASVMVIANSLLDEASRDAARCASMATDAATAQTAAQAAIARHSITNPLVYGLQIVGPVQYVLNPANQIPDPNGGPPLISPAPYVVVNTKVTANMPAAINFGQIATFGNGSFDFNDTACFPILNNPENLPIGSFDKSRPLWNGPFPSNIYPCITPKACPPVAGSCTPPPPAPLVSGPAPAPPPPPSGPPAPPPAGGGGGGGNASE